MNAKPIPPQQVLRERFDYDLELGRLVYRSHPSKNHKHRVGTVAGSRHREGGWQLCIDYIVYLHCRVVWVWVYGADPGELEIDHIDGDRANDRITNLRLANRTQQSWNCGATKRNTSGVKGVSFYKRLGLWRADIRVDGRQKCLGYFKSKEEAAAAYQVAAVQLHGPYYCA